MQKRELWKVVVFGIITFGIYDLFWLASTRKEMVARGAKIPSIWLLALPFIILAGLVVTLVASSIAAGYNDVPSGAPHSHAILNILTILIGMGAIILLIPLEVYWFYKYCKGVEHVTGGQTSLAFAFGLGLVLHFFGAGVVWPAIIQDGFNKYTDGPGGEAKPAPTASSASTE